MKRGGGVGMDPDVFRLLRRLLMVGVETLAQVGQILWIFITLNTPDWLLNLCSSILLINSVVADQF